MHKVNCTISEVLLMDDDVLRIEIQPEQEFGLSDFMELVDAAEQIGHGKKFKNLIIVGIHTLPSKEARDMSSSIEGSVYKLADAFVIHSIAQKIIGNFIINIQKPAVPTRLFTNEEDALLWLKNLD